MQQDCLFNPLSTMSHIRSKHVTPSKHPPLTGTRRKNDIVKRGSVKGSSTCGKVVPLPFIDSNGSLVSKDTNECLLRGTKNILSRKNTNVALWPLQSARLQGTSRPMACPPTVDDTDRKDHGEREELSRIYDSATWRMYYRILSARKRYETDFQVSLNTIGTRRRGREPLTQINGFSGTPRSDECMHDVEKDFDSSISLECIELPELEDEGIFALELES